VGWQRKPQRLAMRAKMAKADEQGRSSNSDVG